jgi:hypothetical protein
MSPEKKERRSLSTQNFVRLLWEPKRGDPVILIDKDTKIRIKTTIDEVGERGILVNAIPARYFLSRNLHYRIQPGDYEKILKRLPSITAYIGKTENPRHMLLGVKHLGRTLPLTGRPRKILTEILELRNSDMTISAAINELVNVLRKERPRGAIRLVPMR